MREHEAAGRYVQVEGQQVFVREQGQGPVVLLVHGVPTSSFLYRTMMGPLADRGMRAVAFDFPGLGLSDKPPGRAYDWHALASSMHAVVTALGYDRVHLVVHDIGGPIAVEWANLHPERVGSLTVTNTLLDVASFKRPFPMNTFVMPAVRHAVFAAQNTPMFTVLFNRRGVLKPISREIVASYLWLLEHKRGRRPFLDVMAGFDLTPEHRDWLRDGLLRLAPPMQVVWGEQEVAIPRHQLEYVRETFPLEHEHYVQARHFLQEDEPERIAAHVSDFVREQTG